MKTKKQPELTGRQSELMRHVFRIYVGGDYWDYSAESADAAREAFIEEIYILAGIPREDLPDSLHIEQLADDRRLTIEDVPTDGSRTVRTCRDWADAQEGLIGTTCY